jgi:hypothetical protein
LHVQVSHSEYIVDLLAFLRRAELRAFQIGPAALEVDLPHDLDLRQAELELELMIRIWTLRHPEVTVRRMWPGGGVTARTKYG